MTGLGVLVVLQGLIILLTARRDGRAAAERGDRMLGMAASRQLHTTALAVFGLAYVAVGILAVSTGDPAFAFGLILTVIGLFLATCTSVLAHQAVAFQYRVFRIRMDKRWFELPGRAFGLLAILYAALMLLGVIRP